MTAESAEARLREYIDQLRALDAELAELDRKRRAIYMRAKADGFSRRAIKAALHSTEEPAVAYLESLGVSKPKDMLRRCYAWNTLIDQPWKIMSIARRDWANVGYSM